MLNFTKRFQGSYFTTLDNGLDLSLQSYGQYSGVEDKDLDGNKWVLSVEGDFEADHQHRAKTKKECVAYANEMKAYFEQLSF